MTYKLSVVNDVTFSGQTMIDQMDLTQTGYQWPERPYGTAEYPLKGYMDVGGRLHGDATPNSFITQSTTGGKYPTPLKAWWTRISPWWVVLADKDNTTTNAGVLVTNGQLYTRNATTKVWTRRGNSNGDQNNLTELGRNAGYYKMADFSALGTPADNVVGNLSNEYGNGIAIPSVRGGALAVGAPGQTNYPLVHGTFGNCEILDTDQIDGIMVTCVYRLFGINGAAYNGASSTRVLGYVGCDPYPTYSSHFGTDPLNVQTYLPCICNSASFAIPIDGTPLRVYATTYKNTNTWVNNGGEYGAVHGNEQFTQVTSAELLASPPRHKPTSFI